jgi:hypothetical protein
MDLAAQNATLIEPTCLAHAVIPKTGFLLLHECKLLKNNNKK